MSIMAGLALAASMAFAAMAQDVVVEFRAMADAPGEGFREAAGADGATHHVAVEPVVSHEDIAQAIAAYDAQSGMPVVNIRLEEASAERFAVFTRAHIGTRLAVMVDGVVISTPMINDAITSGNLVISGHMSMAEAERIAHAITPPPPEEADAPGAPDKDGD